MSRAAFTICLLICLQLLTGNSVCVAQSNLVDRPKRILLPDIKAETLSWDNKEIAQQLEIWSYLTELYDSQNRPSKERVQVLREKIRETLIESYFDGQSVQAEVHREQGTLHALRQELIDKRDRAVQLNNATNFIASGALNTVGSALGFTNALPPFPGNMNQMLSGVVSATMSTYSLKQGAGGKIRGDGHSTMIAELFGRPTDSRTSYPESVWRFLHGRSLESPNETRAQLLEERWIVRNYLEHHGSHKEKQKLDIVCGVEQKSKCISMDDLSDMIHMLDDISAMASQMNHHLRDILSLIDSDVIDIKFN